MPGVQLRQGWSLCVAKKKSKEKSTLSGAMPGASVPRSSPGLVCCWTSINVLLAGRLVTLITTQSVCGVGSSRPQHMKLHDKMASCMMISLMMAHAEPAIGAQAAVATMLHCSWCVVLGANWGPTEGPQRVTHTGLLANIGLLL